ncbi:MAG: LOG family protein [Rhodospirillales bacterium]|jgi:uncharacterized protein (TIGR00730 family)|nr:LOG family protein [Rhodospirillales bacterium]
MSENGVEHQVFFQDDDFMEGDYGRPVRILSEYLGPLSKFKEERISDTIVMFGSARTLSQKDADAKLKEATRTGEGVNAANIAVKNAHYYEAARELASRFTVWARGIDEEKQRFVVCSGGGPGIMEAANRGANDAGGTNIGLNIQLPFEQHENPYITDDLSFQFHYFFMRKFWFVSLAKAVIVFPGGFGTLDEFFELMTLNQTGKLDHKIPIVLFGTNYWSKVLNLDAMAEEGTISPEDVNLFYRTDSIDDAFKFITDDLSANSMDIPGLIL